MKDDEGEEAERRRSQGAMMKAKSGRVAILLIMLALLGRTESAGRLDWTLKTGDLRSDRLGTGTCGSNRFRTD